MFTNTVATPPPEICIKLLIMEEPKVAASPASLVPPKLITMVNAIMPRISSITAAPKIALPARELNAPSSFSVSTVILTEVAVMTTPMKIFCHIKVAIPSICSVLK